MRLPEGAREREAAVGSLQGHRTPARRARLRGRPTRARLAPLARARAPPVARGVGSDLIYDPGVVAPLITTAAASLAPGGRFVLAQSFALGDASSRALDEACGAHKLALEVVERAGEARVWEMAAR